MRMRMKQNMANTFMVNLLRWTFVLRQDRRHSFQAYHTSRPGLNAPGRRQSGEMGHAVDARHNFSNLRMFQLKHAPMTLIRAGRLLDPRTGSVLWPAAVLIENGKIKEVGAPARLQADAPAGVKIGRGSLVLMVRNIIMYSV